MKRVVVAGSGIVAWSAAAALRRHIPSLEVIVVTIPVPLDALADRMISTLPSIVGFDEDLGLPEADTMWGAESGLRIGTVFEGWSEGLPSYVHAYGNYGAAIDGIPFHQLWLRSRAQELVARFDQFCVAAELGRLSRIGLAESAGEQASGIGYGRHLTVDRYHALMHDYALHLGAATRPCRRVEPRIRDEDGFVDALILDTGEVVSADLFIDCTGPAALIHSALHGEFDDWAKWLPCDRMAFTESQSEQDDSMLDSAITTPIGWEWEASSPSRRSRGTVFSSNHAEGHGVPTLLADPGTIEIDIRSGRRRESWLRNCVAIGDAAVMVEPLEWANLHLAHSQIDRLISMMPGQDCAQVEIAEYNRQCGAEADRVRDFICMHYIAARREEPFWRAAAAADPPESLGHTLSLFAERGRLPYYEEETFSRDSWAAVLFGQGLEPRGYDPLADAISIERIRFELDRQTDFIGSFVSAQPMYRDYISNLSQRSIQ